jgi:hypothetical protein
LTADGFLAPRMACMQEPEPEPRGGETYGDGGAILARAASENFVNCSARAEHGY